MGVPVGAASSLDGEAAYAQTEEEEEKEEEKKKIRRRTTTMSDQEKNGFSKQNKRHSYI